MGESNNGMSNEDYLRMARDREVLGHNRHDVDPKPEVIMRENVEEFIQGLEVIDFLDPEYMVKQAEDVSRDHQKWFNINPNRHRED